MIIIDAGISYEYGAYLANKLDETTISTFKDFCVKAETSTEKKICRLRTDCAFESAAWEEYCQCNGITHEFTAPYSSAQNGLAEHAIRTTINESIILLKLYSPS